MRFLPPLFLLLLFFFSRYVTARASMKREAEAEYGNEQQYLTNYVNNADSHQRIAFHSMALLNDYIFIEGGQIATYINGKPTRPSLATEANATLSLPLNKAWTLDKLEINKIPLAEGMRAVNFPGFWADEERNVLYRWGGELMDSQPYEEGHKNQFYMLEPDGQGGGKWTTQSPDPPDSRQNILSSTKGASTFCDGLGFYIGGHAFNGTGNYQLQQDEQTAGVRMYNASSKRWTNDINKSANGPNDNIELGDAICIPGFRKEPLVLVLGGKYGDSGNHRDTTGLTIYDPVSQEWHVQQIASKSDSPGARDGFCMVAAQGKNATLEIFMFGVNRDESAAQQSDIWVLSLPAFKWFKIKTEWTEPRALHRCVLGGKRQMISVGGWATEGMNAFKDKDTFPRGIGIFDLVDFKWKDSYDPDVGEYDSPEEVKKWYTDGNADNIEYAEGLQDIFRRNVSGTVMTGNNTTGDATTNKSINTPVVVGATIGGVLALVLIALGTFWFLRRRRRAAQMAAPLSSKTDDSKANLPEYYQSSKPGSPGYLIPGSNASTRELDSVALTEVECHRSAINEADGLAEMAQPVQISELEATHK